jgi:signal peptidase I
MYLKRASENLIFFKIRGMSMRPFFKTGDMFIVKRTTARDLKIGDIISYYSVHNRSEVCHRLIKIIHNREGYLLYARGDACFNLIEPVEEKTLLGKVIAVIRDKRVIDLTTAYQQLTSRFMAIFAPVIIRIYNRIELLAPKSEFSRFTQGKERWEAYS